MHQTTIYLQFNQLTPALRIYLSNENLSIIARAILLVTMSVCSVVAMAQSAVQREMLDTFVKYASINSQSSKTSTFTQGQQDMALAIRDDVEQAIKTCGAKGVVCIVSPENYVYVTIPSNVKNSCPSLGISCHLDVTPEEKGGDIKPIVDTLDGHTIVRTDGSTLLGADDKCGCTIAMQLIRTALSDRKLKHGVLMFAFCPNEDVGGAADAIDSTVFSPDILFDLDGTGGEVVTNANFTARGLNVKFVGRAAHPGDAKAEKLGDAVAAAATYIASVPLKYRPENTEDEQGYIHPWSFDKKDNDVTVDTRIRYYDKAEGQIFDQIVKDALKRVERDFPNVKVEVLFDGLQYENVSYTLHPQAMTLVQNAAGKIGKQIKFKGERGGTTASMLAAKGLNGGMCVFTGQHEIHSTREYADLQEMEEAYNLMLEVMKQIPAIKD